MNTVLVSYDLQNASEEQYKRVVLAIGSLGEIARIQFSVWVIKTPMSTVQVRDQLKLYLRPNDSLFVSEIDNYATVNVPPKATNLIKNSWSQPKLVINQSFPSIPSRNRPFNPLRKTY